MPITRVAYASSIGDLGVGTFDVDDPLYAGNGTFSVAWAWSWGVGLSLPSPWVLVVDDNFNPLSFVFPARQQMWWNPNGVGGVQFTNPESEGVEVRGAFASFAGVDISGPADFDSVVEVSGFDTSVDAPSVTAAADGSALLTAHCGWRRGGSGVGWSSSPSGMTNVDSGTDNWLVHQVNEDLDVPAGATGTKTATISTVSSGWATAGMSIVLSPGVARRGILVGAIAA